MKQPVFTQNPPLRPLARVHPLLTRQVLSNDDNASETLLVNEKQAERYLLLLKNKIWRQYENVNAIDNIVQRGESIEDAFAAYGYKVEQRRLTIYTIPLHEQMDLYFTAGCADAKVILTEYVVQKEDVIFSYAIVAEVYSPLVYDSSVTATEENGLQLPSLSLLKLYFSDDEPWACAGNRQGTEGYRSCPSFIMAMKEKLHDIIWDALPVLLLTKK